MTKQPLQSHADYIRMLAEIRNELLERCPNLTQREIAVLVRARLDDLQRSDS